MKKYLSVIVLTAAIALASLSCKTSSPDKKASFELIGRWSIDSSYYLGKLEPGINSVIPSLLSMLNEEKFIYAFNADSTINLISATDSTIEKYYLKDSSVFIREDSVFTPYRLGIINNSLITLTSQDSLQSRLSRL